MKLMLYTQYHENYGTDTQPHWKPKFGSEYFVLLPEVITMEAISALVEKAADKLFTSTPYTQEYLIDWSVESEDFLTQFEASQLRYEGEIFHPAKEITL
jgi:alpha-N-acetylglucosamine transferase